MGTYNCRMGDDDSYSSTSMEDDSESELNSSQMFQRMLSHYYRRITFTEVSSDVCVLRGPKIKYKANTSKLDSSEFHYSTKLASGANKNSTAIAAAGPSHGGSCGGNNVASMVLEREKGNSGSNNFSRATQCRISNQYLPNEMVKLENYNGKVFCGTFSKEGSYFATASQDHLIRLYRTGRGRYEHFKTVHARDVGWSIIDVTFSPDEEHFVYSTWSTSLHICPVNGDPEKQEPLRLANTARRFCVFSLAFSADGEDILGGANDGIMFIYNRALNSRTLKINAHEFDINTIAFADDSSHIIYSGSDDGLIKVWDRRTLGEGDPKPVGVLAGHLDGITYINPKGDGRHLISNSKDQSIKLWDVRVFSSECAARNSLRVVHQQTWDYRWQGVPKKMFNIKDRLEGDTSIMTYRGHTITRTLIRCRFSPIETTGQRYIYTGCGAGRLFIYDALTGKVKRDEKKHHACVRDVAWHPYNNEILTSSWDCSVGRWYYSQKESYDKDKEKRKHPENLRRSQRLAFKKLCERKPSSE